MYKWLTGGFFRFLVGLAVFCAAFYGWLEFFEAPLEAWRRLSAEEGNAGRVFLELFNPQSEIIDYRIPFQGYLLLFFSFVVLLMIIQVMWPAADYIRTSRIAVSILEIKVTLCIEEDDMSVATMHREQVIHANRNDVSAYRSEHGVGSGAKIGDFGFETFVGNRLVTKGDPIRRGDGENIEIIERFDAPLPTSFLATYLPNTLVYWLYHWRMAFQRVVAVRRSSMKYLNEYTRDRPMVQVMTLRYPVTNVVMEIDFPETTAPRREDVRCLLISENVVDELTPQRSTRPLGRCVYSIQVPQMSNEQKLRFEWENVCLRLYRKQKGEADHATPKPTT